MSSTSKTIGKTIGETYLAQWLVTHANDSVQFITTFINSMSAIEWNASSKSVAQGEPDIISALVWNQLYTNDFERQASVLASLLTHVHAINEDRLKALTRHNSSEQMHAVVARFNQLNSETVAVLCTKIAHVPTDWQNAAVAANRSFQFPCLLFTKTATVGGSKEKA